MSKDKIVFVPNKGPVRFPSTMRNEDIEKAISKITQNETLSSDIPSEENMGMANLEYAKDSVNQAQLEEKTSTPLQKGLKAAVGGTFDPMAAMQAGGSLASSMAAYPFGVLKGIGTEIMSGEYGEGTDTAEKVAEQFTQDVSYSPKSAAGQRYLQNTIDFLKKTGLEALPPNVNPVSASIGKIGKLRNPLKPSQTVGTSIPEKITGRLIEDIPVFQKGKPKEKVPTTTELKSIADENYKIAENSGLTYPSDQLNNFITGTKSKLGTLSEKRHSKTLDLLDEFEVKSKVNMTLDELESFRQDLNRTIREARKKGEEGDLNRLNEFKSQLDEFYQIAEPQIPKKATMTKEEAVKTLQTARDAYAKGTKARVLDDLFDIAELKAENYSQSGLENALRQKLTQFLFHRKVFSHPVKILQVQQ